MANAKLCRPTGQCCQLVCGGALSGKRDTIGVCSISQRKRAYGSAQFVFEVDMSGLRIVAEDGKVISRQRNGER